MPNVLAESKLNFRYILTCLMSWWNQQLIFPQCLFACREWYLLIASGESCQVVGGKGVVGEGGNLCVLACIERKVFNGNNSPVHYCHSKISIASIGWIKRSTLNTCGKASSNPLKAPRKQKQIIFSSWDIHLLPLNIWAPGFGSFGLEVYHSPLPVFMLFDSD